MELRTAFMKHIFPVLTRPLGSSTGAVNLVPSNDFKISPRLVFPVVEEPFTFGTAGFAAFPPGVEDLTRSAQLEGTLGGGTEVGLDAEDVMGAVVTVSPTA